MLKPENKTDKKRFEEINDQEERQGEDHEKAVEKAAQQVKGMRKAEGRSKEEAPSE